MPVYLRGLQCPVQMACHRDEYVAAAADVFDVECDAEAEAAEVVNVTVASSFASVDVDRVDVDVADTWTSHGEK